ncbi:diguanylate cyclase [Paracoccus sp. (in: a-proteobacteria)]|uniref:diguanylate cyclase n=1 Tax=Paracoccus sp. TaxID=267 RepID=UPI003A837284
MTARILVADGIATHRITLKVRLTAACYDVVIAPNTAQLSAFARHHRPDLIILGGGFGDERPIDLCQRLATDPDLAAIPVLILADAPDRLEALRAGAAAVLEPAVDEHMLLARIRSILRDSDSVSDRRAEMAEPPAIFDAAPARITLVADSPGRGLCWKHLLGPRLPYRFIACDPEEALRAASDGRGSDLYLIAADIETRGDGLRLLSELRSRNGSRHSGFLIATMPGREEIHSIALDLGAGEVLPVNLGGAAGIEETALAVESQLLRKQRADKLRAEDRHNLQLAMTDPLTGLYNRRYALPRLAEAAHQSLENASNFAVLIMDLDWFKRVNDRYGHAAGDAVLRNVAQILDQAIATDGLTARLGGEEFLAILPDADEAKTFRIAETIRRAVEAHPTRLPNRNEAASIRATLSIGAAIMTGAGCSIAHDMMAELILERADQALLTAKSLGRNRVMLAQAEYAA